MTVIRMRVNRKEQGAEWPRGWTLTGGGVWGEIFKIFKQKCSVLCIFIAKNYVLVAGNQDNEA